MFDMDLLKQRLYIAQKIAEELTGTITEEDSKKLSLWLEEDESHRYEYEKIRESLVSDTSAWDSQEEGLRLVDSQWEKVNYHIFRKNILLLKWSRYVAAVLIPLFIALFFFLGEYSNQISEDTIVVSSIMSGKVTAQLELSDGKKILLDNESNFKVNEICGIDIHTADNTLKYEGVLDTIISQSEEVKYNTLTVPRGGEFVLSLGDGTRVWLNSESKLRYPVCFTDKERRVEMLGEIYFEVAKNEDVPFIVSANGVDISVIGTNFNVSTYRNEVVTTLVEGKVKLRRGSENVILLPNQQAVLTPNNKFNIKEVNARNYTLWKDGVFYFEDANLDTILETMSRWYNVNIFYMNPSLKTRRFSIEIKRYENINDILRKIEQTKCVRFKVNGRTINVYK